MHAYEAIIRVLEAENVDTVFTLMAEDTLHLLADLEEHWQEAIQVIESRHEQGAMAMADGYARASGTVGVAIVGRGPGIAQTGTSLVTARKAGSNLLVIVPAPPVSSAYDVKAFDQDAFLRSTVGNVVSVESRDTLVGGVEEGFRRVHVGEGPVAVQVPWDLLEADLSVPDDHDWGSGPVSGGDRPRLEPTMDQVESAVDLYLDSDATKHPLILAGRGAIRSDARSALVALAERMDAALATTLQARGYFEDHPSSVGFVGEWGATLANEYLVESDFLLAVGCSLNPHTTDDEFLIREDAKVVQVDSDPTVFGQHTSVDLGIEGDARATASALDETLEGMGIDRESELWSEQERTRVAETPSLDGGEFPDDPGTIDPRDLVSTIDELLPADRLVVSDGGHFTRWVVDGIGVPTPDEFVWTLDFAAIGQGLGAGIGAAQTVEDRPCVTFCGDAGFMMAIQEVETAARHDVPITVVVMNDSALGSEYHNLAPSGDYAEAALIDTPDLAAVAESLGATGFTVRGVDDLEALSADLAAVPEGPRVIDCKVNHQVRHRSKE